jgi:hypothetical protein
MKALRHENLTISNHEDWADEESIEEQGRRLENTKTTREEGREERRRRDGYQLTYGSSIPSHNLLATRIQPKHPRREINHSLMKEYPSIHHMPSSHPH